MIYISSLCSTKKRIADSVLELVQLGFRNIELTGETEFYENLERDLMDLKDRYKLSFLIHNYFPPQPEEFVLNLASKSLDSKKKALNLIKQAVSLSRKFGEDLYSVHPGFRNDLIPQLKDGFFMKEDERVNSRQDLYQTIDMILDEIIPEGFRIAVENLSPKSSTELYSFLCSPEDIEQFLDYYHNRPDVGIVLDFGHLNVASARLNFDKNEVLNNLFFKYRDQIFEIHISENNGQADSHKILSVDSWQIEFLSQNKEILKHIPIVLEWHNSSSSLAFERFKMVEEKLLGKNKKEIVHIGDV